MSNITARPMAQHAFIEREKQEKTVSGLFLPESAKRDRQHTDSLFRGKVLSLGGDKGWDFLKVGDTVLFEPAETSEVQVAEDHWVFSVPQKSILAVEEV